MFQNEMNSANRSPVNRLGQDLARKLDGKHALANMVLARTLREDQQSILRQTYFGALKSVWSMVCELIDNV
jgi:hypothetical protein